VLLSLCLVFGAPFQAYAGENDMLPEVREILNNNYVDPVGKDVLQAKTVKEMLAKLGDRDTEYLPKKNMRNLWTP
jgi:carboxyl-terminal processing protease